MTFQNASSTRITIIIIPPPIRRALLMGLGASTWDLTHPLCMYIQSLACANCAFSRYLFQFAQYLSGQIMVHNPKPIPAAPQTVTNITRPTSLNTHPRNVTGCFAVKITTGNRGFDWSGLTLAANQVRYQCPPDPVAPPAQQRLRVQSRNQKSPSRWVWSAETRMAYCQRGSTR
jgi:hypothetical protein